MIRKIIISALLLLCFCQILSAKSYPFDMNHSYEVQQVQVGKEGTKFLKVWGVAGSPDKAIDRAMQDAVAACLFVGVEATETAGKVPALCGGLEAYSQNKEYFDKFFKKGAFMQYVKNVNKGYPSGEDNVSTNRGRKVGLYVQIMYDELRKRLEEDGIIRSLDSYF
ncbi:MAG: hypothetical protein II864_07630 [Prevotella sp.]|nr:hypothetical protein [Prevotella sp.]